MIRTSTTTPDGHSLDLYSRHGLCMNSDIDSFVPDSTSFLEIDCGTWLTQGYMPAQPTLWIVSPTSRVRLKTRSALGQFRNRVLWILHGSPVLLIVTHAESGSCALYLMDYSAWPIFRELLGCGTRTSCGACRFSFESEIRAAKLEGLFPKDLKRGPYMMRFQAEAAFQTQHITWKSDRTRLPRAACLAPILDSVTFIHVYFILFAFITGNSSFGPLLEGLISQIYVDLSFRFSAGIEPRRKWVCK